MKPVSPSTPQLRERTEASAALTALEAVHSLTGALEAAERNLANAEARNDRLEEELASAKLAHQAARKRIDELEHKAQQEALTLQARQLEEQKRIQEEHRRLQNEWGELRGRVRDQEQQIRSLDQMLRTERDAYAAHAAGEPTRRDEAIRAALATERSKPSVPPVEPPASRARILELEAQLQLLNERDRRWSALYASARQQAQALLREVQTRSQQSRDQYDALQRAQANLTAQLERERAHWEDRLLRLEARLRDQTRDAEERTLRLQAQLEQSEASERGLRKQIREIHEEHERALETERRRAREAKTRFEQLAQALEQSPDSELPPLQDRVAIAQALAEGPEAFFQRKRE